MPGSVILFTFYNALYPLSNIEADVVGNEKLLQMNCNQRGINKQIYEVYKFVKTGNE
jgi:hypothetical protein